MNAIDDVIFGCANQAGEDNRNVARMALLLAGLPQTVAGTTVNRLCGSSMDAIAIAARAIKTGENSLLIAGGVESMSRAPFVMGKADAAFSRAMKLEDTTMGWRFVNPAMKTLYGTDSMPETGENVAEEFTVSREDQDAFAYRSQQRAAAAIQSGALAEEITPVTITPRKGPPIIVDKDEHPRGGHHSRRSGCAQTSGQIEWHNYRRQCIWHKRWRLRRLDGVGRSCEALRSEAEGSRSCLGGRRSRSTHHGSRTGAGGA